MKSPIQLLLPFLLIASSYLLSSTEATDNGLTDQIAWDSYSLMVNGSRVFIFSGEFHYERLPVPELWLDVFQRFRSNGLNAVSLYFFWSYHSPSRGVIDLKTAGKDIQRVLDAAKEAGLYVIARPGPYCNAETNAGGFALWTSDGTGGELRTSDETYHGAWLPWIEEVNGILAKNQYPNGPVILYQIENELTETRHEANNTLVLYMEQIKQASRDSGIVVPFISNEKGQRGQSWSTDYQDVGGSVDIYGLDSYPGGLKCGANINSGFNLVRTYYQWFQNYSYTQPEFWPEFESGWFQPWGSDYFYDSCISEHDPAFADVYYKNNIGQRGTLINLYMAAGFTNWGNLAAPVVFTSYDYSAPMRETREIQAKFSQTKLIALFTRVSADLLYTEMESNGTGNAVSTNDIWTWVLRNPETGTGFYTTQHNKSSSRAVTDFSIDLRASIGTITVSGMQLNGRQSKIAVTDYHFGQKTLLYSSVDVLTYGVFNEKEVLVLYLQEGQVGEFGFLGNVSIKSQTNMNLTSNFVQANGSRYTRFIYKQPKGKSVIQLSNGVLLYLLDIPSAWQFFSLPTDSNPNVTPEKQIFVLGPYLVRNVTVQGEMVAVSGDNTNATTIEVYAGDSNVDTIMWNGKYLSTRSTAYGSLTAQLDGVQNRTVHIPSLSNWKVADSLPEAARDYDDSAWIVCNKSTTLARQKPLSLPVLYSSDYGYYTGIKVYRGYFDGKTAVSANLTAQGGLASGWSAWLNGKLVGGSPGNASLSATSDVLDFNTATLYEKDNVLTVVTDYTGHDQMSTDRGAENPRGLLGASLQGAGNSTLNFMKWKIQGNAGGSANIDPVRGPLNEGGLFGERAGWHLPGFSPSGEKWSQGSPTQGSNTSGVNWYLTTFDLDIDSDLDVPIGLELSSPPGTVASVQIFLNGYQYGKYIPQMGPQTKFPFPPGVLNNQGTNTIALSVWAQTDVGVQLDKVSLFAYGVYETSFDYTQDWSYLQPDWSDDRLQYA